MVLRSLKLLLFIIKDYYKYYSKPSDLVYFLAVFFTTLVGDLSMTFFDL